MAVAAPAGRLPVDPDLGRSHQLGWRLPDAEVTYGPPRPAPRSPRRVRPARTLPPTPGPDCGTRRGYWHHGSRGEHGCSQCLAANREAEAARVQSAAAGDPNAVACPTCRRALLPRGDQLPRHWLRADGRRGALCPGSSQPITPANPTSDLPQLDSGP